MPMNDQTGPKPALPTLGMRHLALNVKNVDQMCEFYERVLLMEREWQPDPKSMYLVSKSSSGQVLDNLALHESAAPLNKATALNHIGFFVPTLEDVDTWYNHVKQCGAKIVKEIKTHRDGARSFYFEDCEGNVIQLLYYPRMG